VLVKNQNYMLCPVLFFANIIIVFIFGKILNVLCPLLGLVHIKWALILMIYHVESLNIHFKKFTILIMFIET